MTIRIQHFTGQYQFLSNFYRTDVLYLGICFPTAEHAYQWLKMATPEDKRMVLNARGPGDAKRAGRRGKAVANWDTVKFDIMRDVLRAKFRNVTLAKWLLQTGNAELVEGNTWGDVIWGVCDGVGENWLGRLLMEVRTELRR